MTCLLLSLIVFLTVVNSNARKSLFLPQLPVGEYRLSFLGIMNCVSDPLNNKIKFGLYLSKKSANTSEIKGNVTILFPLDDSFNIQINMAIKDSIGVWKDNAFVFKTHKACSSLKQLAGNAWTPVTEGLGMHNATCPIPVGVFKADGIDSNTFMLLNLPKSFFYGTYKARFSYTKNKIVYGCVLVVIEVKRLWETD